MNNIGIIAGGGNLPIAIGGNLIKKNSIENNLTNLDKKYENILEIEEMIQFLKKSNKRGIATFVNE